MEHAAGERCRRLDDLLYEAAIHLELAGHLPYRVVRLPQLVDDERHVEALEHLVIHAILCLFVC